MSPLRPKFLLDLLTNSMLSSQKMTLSKKSRSLSPAILKAATVALTFGGLVSMVEPAQAQAVTFDWTNQAWDGGTLNGGAANPYQIGGVTLNFNVSQSAGSTFDSGTPDDSDDLPGGVNLTGGLATGNLLLVFDPATVGDTVGINVDFLNAAGNRVPVENLTYTLVDIDRDNDRGWQDVLSAVSLFNGATVPPSIIAGSGLDLLTGTVENITGTATAIGYPEPAGAVTFRGVTDRDDATLTPPSDPVGVEAGNQIDEGSVILTYGNNAVDEIQITYGNGPGDAASNGLGFDLDYVAGGPSAGDPSPHGMGFLGDFRFDPGIIGVAKEVTNVVDNNDGSFNITYSVRVENVGETPLSNVQLDDNLIAPSSGITTNTFSATGGTDPFTIVTAPASTDVLTLNPAYDGGNTGAGAQLLGAGNTLAVGEAKTLTYTLQVTPGAGSTLRYDTQVSATGNTPNGGVTTDISNDGAAVEDGAGDLDPTAVPGADFPVNAITTTGNGSTVAIGGSNTGDDTITVAVLPAQPRIGVTKQVSNVADNGDGTYTVTYRQIVRNLGNEALNGVTLTDQAFATTFRTGTATGVTSAALVGGSISVPGAAPAGFPAGYTALTGTPGFDGAGNLQLATVASLPVGGYGIVDYQVLVDPTDPIDGTIENLGDGPLGGGASPNDDPPYESQVTAAGTGAVSTTPVTDLSDDVTGFPAAADQLPRDLNGNGTATDPESTPGIPQSSPIPADPANDETTDENNRTPVTFAGSPAIALSKRVTNVTANPDGTFDVTYRQLVQNIGSVTLDNVQIAEDTSILNTFRVGDPNGATSAVVQSVTAVPPGTVAPGAPGGINLTAGLPADLEGANRTLLSGTNTLQPGEFGAVDYVVRVLPGNNTAGYGGNNLPFSSQATATGITTTLGGTPVTDPSDDGVEFPNGTPGVAAIQTLDPDNNNNANEGAATLAPIDPDGNTTTTATQDSENNPTPVRFPKLAISKNISGVTGSGTPADPYIVSYDVTVENVGGIRLNGVQVTEENIDAVFDDLPPGDTTVVGPVTQVSGIPVTVNPAFDGEGTPQLIAPGTPLTLDPTQSSTLRYQVQVVNPTNGRPYDSSSTTSGTGIPADGNGPVAGNPLTVAGDANADGILEAPASTGILPVSDLSDDGTLPDPITTDGNRGGGPGENDPTVVTFPVGPQIGLTKQVISTTPVPGQPGSFDVTFEYRVQNIGIVPLNGLDITDNYDTQFDIGQPTAVANYEVISVTPGGPETPGGPTLIGNGAVVGSTPNSGNLSVSTGNTTVFAPGEAARTQVVVRVTPDPNNLSTVYANSAIATGTQSNSTVVPAPTATDLSDDIPPAGATDPRLLTPNPNTLGGSTPTLSADDATPVIFDLISVDLQLFKTITSTSRGDNFTGIQEVPGAPPGVVGTIRVPEQLQPGDIVEYTIYYFNSGATAFSGLEICDPLPSPLVPVQPILGGIFIDPLTPVPVGNVSCTVNDEGLAVQVDGDGNPTSVPNGAVIFPVGDVPPGTLGSVVFEAQIP